MIQTAKNQSIQIDLDQIDHIINWRREPTSSRVIKVSNNCKYF